MRRKSNGAILLKVLWNRLDGIDDVSANVAVAWLASVSVYTVNVHESALDSVLGTVECNPHHRVKWNLKTE